MGLKSSARSQRKKYARDSFTNAADCLAPIEHEMSVFALTRGQFSMIDAVLACLDVAGPSHITVWSWSIASYEMDLLYELKKSGKVLSGLLIIDLAANWAGGGEAWKGKAINKWSSYFGEDRIRTVVNHAKMASVYNDNWKFLLRGSLNFNHNPRFEQLDVSEGGPEFDLIHELEQSFPQIGASPTKEQAVEASGMRDNFNGGQQLNMFDGGKIWSR